MCPHNFQGPNGFNLTPHSISFSSTEGLIFPHWFANLPWLWTRSFLPSVSLIALPFKQTVHDTKWDGTSVSFFKTAGKWQKNHRHRLQEPSWSWCSRANEAQKRLLTEDQEFSSAEHWFTHVEPRRRPTLQLPEPLFFHSDKDINVTITHQMQWSSFWLLETTSSPDPSVLIQTKWLPAFTLGGISSASSPSTSYDTQW